MLVKVIKYCINLVWAVYSASSPIRTLSIIILGKIAKKSFLIPK